MPGKRVQFDDETWQAIDAVARGKGKTFQQLADEAFKDLLEKHRQPVGLKAALKQSVGGKGKVPPLRAQLHSPMNSQRISRQRYRASSSLSASMTTRTGPSSAQKRTARRGARPSDADHADGELCRNPCHGSAETLLHLGSSCYVLA